MKKLFIIVLGLVWTSGVFALQIPETENYTLTTDTQQVLDTQGINDPLRDGAYKLINSDPNSPGWSGSLAGIVGVDSQITDHATAKNATLQVVKNIVNYALGLLSLIALVYLIFNGFLILTAGGDDTQYKKGLKSIKNALIAIAGIGASRLIVSAIFRLISLVI